MPPKPRKPRLSKLAKENNLSAEEEAEIKEAFHLFTTEPDEDNEEFAHEKEGVIKTQDVRRALIALGLSPTDSEELASILSAVDPTRTGYTTYAPFVSVAALKLRSRTDDSISADVEHAFHLFTRGSEGPITLSHLRRVARDLKEEVSDELLRDMIQEANGGEGISKGVTVEQFRSVMERAGAF